MKIPKNEKFQKKKKLSKMKIHKNKKFVKNENS